MDLVTRLRLERDGKLHGGIYHVTQVEMSYNSNKIEGSRISEKQTALIFEKNMLPPSINGESTTLDDIKETENHFKGFDYILDHVDEPLSLNMFKEIHAILKRGTTQENNPITPVGDFKILENVIDGAVDNIATTPPEEVPQKLTQLLDTYLSEKNVDLERIVDFHVQFERIHPFADGNGRTGRLIMFKECLKHNITPFALKDVHRDFYYRGLKEWDHEKGYLLDTVGLEQDMYQSFLEKMGFKGPINEKNIPTNKFEERVKKSKEDHNTLKNSDHTQKNKIRKR